MTLEEAKEVLNECIRCEGSDPIFGDHTIDVSWFRIDDDAKLADGQFSEYHSSVYVFGWKRLFIFKGNEAKELRKCGRSV